MRLPLKYISKILLILAVCAVCVVLFFAVFLGMGQQRAFASDPGVSLQVGDQAWHPELLFTDGERPLILMRSLAEQLPAEFFWEGESGFTVWLHAKGGVAFRAEIPYIYVFGRVEADIADVNLVGEHTFWRKVESGGGFAVKSGNSCIDASLLPYMGILAVWDENFSQLDLSADPELYNLGSDHLGDYGSFVTVYEEIKADAEAELARLPQQIGAYTTYFNPDEKNRTINLKLAAAALHEQQIGAGANFSFNQTVGSRTPQRGYLKAIIFVEGEEVLGYGGGVCQVSSTLYNAVLEADLKVLERHSHSLPVGYVPTGKDATVAYGSKDFCFQNDGAKPLTIKCTVGKNSLRIELWQ